MMDNEERQKLEEKSYLKLYISYKKQLRELGVPVDTLGDTMISALFFYLGIVKATQNHIL